MKLNAGDAVEWLKDYTDLRFELGDDCVTLPYEDAVALRKKMQELSDLIREITAGQRAQIAEANYWASLQ